MGLEEIIGKLRTLGVFPNNSSENAEIFEKCENLDEIRQEMIKLYPACGSSQFVYIHLNALLKQNPEYKSKFLRESKLALGELGIQSEHIVEYFQSGTSPRLALAFKNEEGYSDDIRTNFYQRADQFALNKIREWLGVKNSN